MMLKVPFQKKLKRWEGNGWCGPIALASILKYYGVAYKVEDIVKHTGYQTGIAPKALAHYCLSKGLSVVYINKDKEKVSDRLKEFLKKIKAEEQGSKFDKKLRRFQRYKFIQKEHTIKDLEGYIMAGKPVLLHLNIARIYKKRNLWPHYIVVVGFDKENIYIHNTYPENVSYQKVSKELFKKAWNLDGWNKEVLVPYK